MPSLKRSAPAYYLEAGERQILVDCGCGTILQLQKAKKDYREIDAVFITHTHPDHVSGLIPFIHALLATPSFTREKDLFLIGSKGFKRFYEKCIYFLIGKHYKFPIQVREIEDKMDYPPLHVFSAMTIHSEDSIAFRFEHEEKSIVFTGDSDYDRGIIELSKNADILIADCSFPDSMKGKGHMTPRECGMVAKEANVKKLLLSHLYPVPFPDEERIKECKIIFHGTVELSEDLLELNI